MPTIVHFEIPTDNVERSRKFYSELFDWNVEKWTGTESQKIIHLEYGKRIVKQ